MPNASVLFGKQLRKVRESRNISQEKLEELCNFSRHYVGRVERAERVASFEFMMRMAYVLAVPPAEFYKLIPVPKRMPKKGAYKGIKKPSQKKQLA